MNIRAVQMSDLFKECDDIYTNVVVISQRAKQIINQRVIHIDEYEDVEDSIQFEEDHTETIDLDKPMIVALEEYLNGELNWRRKSDEEEETKK